MSQEINQRILDALNEGHNPQDILGALSMSKDPEHQSWYENYSQNMRDRARESSMLDQRAIPGKPGLGLTQRVKAHVEETPGEQLALEAGGLAAAAYAGKRAIQKAFPTPGEQGLAEQNKIARERLEMQKGTMLSPLEEARIETEKAKAELHRKKIEMMDRQMAKAEAGKQLSPADQSLLNLYEQQRAAKQANAQIEVNKQMGFAPPAAPATPTAAPAVPAAQSPAPAPIAQAAAQTAPVAPPTVAQIAQQTAPAITEAAQTPAAAIPPAAEEKKKGGAPSKEQRAAAPFYLNKEEIRKSQGEMNSYLNMLGYDKKNPDSPRSQAAKVSFEMFMNEGLEGKVARGVSGKPVSHEGIYKPWLEKNFQFLPEQTQVFLLEQQQKASKRGVPPVVPPTGGAIPPSSGGGGGGFLQKPTTPGGMLHNLNPLRLE